MLLTHAKKFNYLKLLVFGTLLMMAVSPVFAALPVISPPTGGGIGGAQVQNNDILGMMGAYFKQGITIFAYVMVALSGLIVIVGAFTRWRKYSAGQMELGDVKEYLINGVVLVVFIALLAKWGLDTLA